MANLTTVFHTVSACYDIVYGVKSSYIKQIFFHRKFQVSGYYISSQAFGIFFYFESKTVVIMCS